MLMLMFFLIRNWRDVSRKAHPPFPLALSIWKIFDINEIGKNTLRNLSSKCGWRTNRHIGVVQERALFVFFKWIFVHIFQITMISLWPKRCYRSSKGSLLWLFSSIKILPTVFFESKIFWIVMNCSKQSRRRNIFPRLNVRGKYFSLLTRS